MRTRRYFSEAMKKWINDNSLNYTAKEIIPIIKDKFNIEFTLKEMLTYYIHNNIEYKRELPKKGHSNNALPIGSERIKADGMHQIKVGDHKWEYKQRYIYEQYYGVKLPEDMYVIFLDQDRNNFDINNLKAISRKESAYMANQGIFSKDKNATELGIKVAKLKIKTKEMENIYE